MVHSFLNNLGPNSNKNEDNTNGCPFGVAKNLFKNMFGGQKWDKCGMGDKKWGKCGMGGKFGGWKNDFAEHKKEFVRSVVREELEKMFPGHA